MRELLKKKYVQAALLALATVVVYANTLGNGFVYDDLDQILRNHWIRDTKYLYEIFTSPIGAFLPNNVSSGTYRPMLHTAYLVEYALFGLNPRGYHLVNLLLACAVSVMAFLLTARVMKNGENGGGASFSPFFAALYFAVHPAHSEVVAWAATVTELLLAFFLFFAFYLHAGQRPSPVKTISASVFLFIALLNKETALVFPFLALAYDRMRPPVERRWGRYISYAVVIAVYFVLRTYAVGDVLPGRRFFDLTDYEYAINILQLVPLYFYKLAVPVNLNAYYFIEPLRSLSEPFMLFSAAFSIFVLAALYISRRLDPVLFFSAFWVSFSMLPTMYLPGLGKSWFAERYLFLPSFGFCLFAARALYMLASRFKGRGVLKTVLYPAVGVVMALLVFQTVRRNAVWRDDLTLWADTVVKSPKASLPRQNLGDAFYKAGRVDDALREFKAASALDPTDYLPLYNLGFVHQVLGRHDEAIAYYTRAIMIKSNDPVAHFNLGLVYRAVGMREHAVREFRAALALKPGFVEVGYALDAMLREGEAGD